MTDTASPLRRLIGTWEFEASSEGRFLGRGVATFEWMEGGAFVLEGAEDAPTLGDSPDWTANSPMPVTSVLGFDDMVYRRVGVS